MTLYLCIEVAGCPTICRHCWAQGVSYGAMPVEDVAWVLDWPTGSVTTAGWPSMPTRCAEMAAHPDTARLFGLFNDHCASARHGTMFEPLPTTGVPLAMDWRDVLQAAADTGTVNVWVAFHGASEEHDRQVNRRGAFAETCLAVERTRVMGLSAGCNVFVTTASLPRLDELVATLGRLPIDAEMSWEIAVFLTTPRSRRNESLRPSLPDLLPVAGQIAELTAPFNRDQWASLEASTEAAYVRRAIADDWPAAPNRLT